MMWWLIGEDVVAHYRRYDGSLEEMWWLIRGDMIAHKRKCDGSLEEI